MYCCLFTAVQVASASVKTDTMDYMKPVRAALYTEKITVPSEVSVSCSHVGLPSTGKLCDGSASAAYDLNITVPYK